MDRVSSDLHKSPHNERLPIGERLRPTQFDALVGQKIWGQGSPLRRLVEADRFTALLFWGPPGTGKTSLSLMIAQATGRAPELLSAVSAGVKDLREAIARSELARAEGRKAHLLFVDEIHRLSKNQQDVLLPALESGAVKFIGATTENPSFEVNSAINSRALVFRFETLSEKSLEQLLEQAIANPNADLTRRDIAPDVLAAIARSAAGDARRALGLLEAVTTAADPQRTPIDREALAACAGLLPLRYDKAADQHYDTISAFIKSIRASQADAALHYLARMIASGEEPEFIARRLMISASEDIGNANPMGLIVAVACRDAVRTLGFPEARIPLAQATTYLALSPKSNRAYLAIDRALEDVQSFGALEIPLSLRNGVTALMRETGYGKEYVYAHDDPEGARRMSYLPEALKGRVYYEPKDVGVERQLKEQALKTAVKPVTSQPSSEKKS